MLGLKLYGEETLLDAAFVNSRSPERAFRWRWYLMGFLYDKRHSRQSQYFKLESHQNKKTAQIDLNERLGLIR